MKNEEKKVDISKNEETKEVKKEEKKLGKLGIAITSAIMAGGLFTAIPAGIIADKLVYKAGMSVLPIKNPSIRSKIATGAGFGAGCVAFDMTMRSTTEFFGNMMDTQETVNDATKRYLKAREEKAELMAKLQAQMEADAKAKAEKMVKEEKHNIFEDAEKEEKEDKNGEG